MQGTGNPPCLPDLLKDPDIVGVVIISKVDDSLRRAKLADPGEGGASEQKLSQAWNK